MRYEILAHDAMLARYTECANKKQTPLKNLYFSKGPHGFEAFFQNLYVSIRTTYRANFIETTDMVQQIPDTV